MQFINSDSLLSSTLELDKHKSIREKFPSTGGVAFLGGMDGPTISLLTKYRLHSGYSAAADHMGYNYYFIREFRPLRKATHCVTNLHFCCLWNRVDIPGVVVLLVHFLTSRHQQMGDDCM